MPTNDGPGSRKHGAGRPAFISWLRSVDDATHQGWEQSAPGGTARRKIARFSASPPATFGSRARTQKRGVGQPVIYRFAADELGDAGGVIHFPCPVLRMRLKPAVVFFGGLCPRRKPASRAGWRRMRCPAGGRLIANHCGQATGWQKPLAKRGKPCTSSTLVQPALTTKPH